MADMPVEDDRPALAHAHPAGDQMPASSQVERQLLADGRRRVSDCHQIAGLFLHDHVAHHFQQAVPRLTGLEPFVLPTTCHRHPCYWNGDPDAAGHAKRPETAAPDLALIRNCRAGHNAVVPDLGGMRNFIHEIGGSPGPQIELLSQV